MESQLNLYQLNRQLVAALPTLTTEQLETAAKGLDQFKDNCKCHYFMLLSNELRYYTVFKIEPYGEAIESFGDLLVSCLREIGDIKSIEVIEDGTAEIWVSSPDNPETADVFYLFPYDNGVLVCQ
jgi:hypothetical protein